MANYTNYTKKAFSSSQNFLARDPSDSGTVIRVGGQSILDAAVAEILAQNGIVMAADTLTEAIATDYESGVFVVTGGSTTVLDGGQSIYRVSDAGSGGVVMANGNELMLLFQANTGDAGNYNVGTAAGQIPLNSDLGSARLVDTGTAPSEVPLNSDGSGITQLNASNLSSGTVPNARLNIPFTVGYLSSAQTIVSAGLITLAHGLGAVPKLIQFELECTTAEGGYSIGDKIIVSAINNSTSATTRENSVYFDSTNVYVRFSSDTNPFVAGVKNTGGAVALTNSSWELYVRAFA